MRFGLGIKLMGYVMVGVLVTLLIGAMLPFAWAAPKQHTPGGQVTMGIPVEMIKRFAFGDEKALLQRASESMDVKLTDFSHFVYLRHYDNIAKAVLAGDFDGGILKDSVPTISRTRASS